MDEPLTGGTTPGTEGMVLTLLKYTNREQVAKALTERGYSVTRVTVNRWAAGSEMPPIAARMILELFGHQPDTTKEPPPRWARELRNDLLSAISAAGLTTQERAALRAIDATATPMPEDDADPDEEDMQVQAHG